MFVQAIFVLGSMLTALAIGIDASLYLLQRYQLQHALLDTVRLHTRTHMPPTAFADELKAQIQRLRLPQPLGWPHSWYAEQISPSDEDFEHFQDPHLAQRLEWAYPAINNDYQAHQHSLLQVSTAPRGRNIFTANTLQLNFYYAYRPYNPIIRALFKGLQSWAQHPYTQQLLAVGLLPIRIDISHPYASHPVAWPHQSNLPYHRKRRAAAVVDHNGTPTTHLMPTPLQAPPNAAQTIGQTDAQKENTQDDKKDTDPVADEVISQDLLPGGTDTWADNSDQPSPPTEAPTAPVNDDPLSACDHPACCG